MTAPLTLPPGCSVWANGNRMADGQPGEADTAPVVLTDLKVTWGRSNTLDQPAPSTCDFTVLDRAGGQSFLSQLRVGTRIEVRAEATVYPSPSDPVMTDPSFEATAPTVKTTNATAVRSTARFRTGSRSVVITPVDAKGTAKVIFPPEPFSSDVSAWNDTPRTALGQTWKYGASVWLGQYLSTTTLAVARVRPVTFTKPDGSDATVLSPTLISAATAGVWQDLAGTFVPPAGVWLGIQVELTAPTGPVWTSVPTAVTWTSITAPGPSWNDLASVWVDDLVLLAPAAGAVQSGTVFSGRVTDLKAQYGEATGGTMVDVIAQSHLAELANRYVGTSPWGKESVQARFNRVVSSSGQVINWTVDPTVANVQMSWRDIDYQPADSVLIELAKSVGGALWSATSQVTGPYLWLEDIDARPALQVLAMGTDNLVHVVNSPNFAAKGGFELSACDVLLEPVTWVQTSEDDSTRVALTWQAQTLDDKGQQAPTSTIEEDYDAALEAATGQRRISVTTQLALQPDAQRVVASYLGRASTPGWRVAGLVWDMEKVEKLDADTLTKVMTILDGTTRIGVPLLLTDLPTWSPVSAGAELPLFLEGGTFTNTDGAWTLELLTSSAAAQGASKVNWNQVSSGWAWNEMGPEISWNDLRGVGV
jgi:hypothetical protein